MWNAAPWPPHIKLLRDLVETSLSEERMALMSATLRPPSTTASWWCSYGSIIRASSKLRSVACLLGHDRGLDVGHKSIGSGVFVGLGCGQGNAEEAANEQRKDRYQGRKATCILHLPRCAKPQRPSARDGHSGSHSSLGARGKRGVSGSSASKWTCSLILSSRDTNDKLLTSTHHEFPPGRGERRSPISPHTRH